MSKYGLAAIGLPQLSPSVSFITVNQSHYSPLFLFLAVWHP
jgi:hypothetical protein